MGLRTETAEVELAKMESLQFLYVTTLGRWPGRLSPPLIPAHLSERGWRAGAVEAWALPAEPAVKTGLSPWPSVVGLWLPPRSPSIPARVTTQHILPAR